jgi:DNA-binding NarL/FixJ family response regulator
MARTEPRRALPGHLLDGTVCLLPARPSAGTGASGLHSLTPAEERLMPYLLAGLANKEVADRVGRAESTIKHQTSSILRKFGVCSRARLIALLR